MTAYNSCIKLLNALHKEHPSFSLGRHLSTALAEYGDIWGMTDKELLFALTKYQTEQTLNEDNISHEDYVNKIVKEGMNLDTILDEEEEDI